MNVRMVVKLAITFTFQVNILCQWGSADKKFEFESPFFGGHSGGTK